jgi:hypothetical protein
VTDICCVDAAEKFREPQQKPGAPSATVPRHEANRRPRMDARVSFARHHQVWVGALSTRMRAPHQRVMRELGHGRAVLNLCWSRGRFAVCLSVSLTTRLLCQPSTLRFTTYAKVSDVNYALPTFVTAKFVTRGRERAVSAAAAPVGQVEMMSSRRT